MQGSNFAKDRIEGTKIFTLRFIQKTPLRAATWKINGKV
jgi:hypothetical protein